jgi:hypothetical protein
MSEYIVRVDLVQLFDNGAERLIDRLGSDSYDVDDDDDDDDGVEAVSDLYHEAAAVIADSRAA